MLQLIRKILGRENANSSVSNLIFEQGIQSNIRQIRKTIYQEGCVVIPNFLPVEDIDSFAELVERSFDVCKSILKILEISESDKLESISDPRVRKLIHNIRIGQIEPLYFQYLNNGASLYSIMMNKKIQRNFVLSVLGNGWYEGSSIIRKVAPCSRKHNKLMQQPISMHCDGPIISRHSYSLNFWIPLHDCMGEAPGIQFVPGPFAHLQEKMKHDWNTGTVDHAVEDELRRLYSNQEDGFPRFIPSLKRGDLVIFHNWVMHGSYATSKMKKCRSSLELRFNAPKRKLFESFAN